MAEDGYLVGESLLREFKRALKAQALKLTTLERRLATVAVRRHQGVYIPGRMPVKFRNDSSEEVPPYAVMRVTGGVDGPIITIDKPNSTFNRFYLVNGKNAVVASKTGKGTWLHEADYASYNSSSGTPAYGEVWGPKSGQWTLEKYRSGFTIQGHTTTIDTVDVVLAVQAHVDLLIGKADAAIANGASGTCSVWMGAAGSEADTTWNVTAFNRSSDVALGDWVSLSFVHGQWYLAPLECPEEE